MAFTEQMCLRLTREMRQRLRRLVPEVQRLHPGQTIKTQTVLRYAVILGIQDLERQTRRIKR